MAVMAKNCQQITCKKWLKQDDESFICSKNEENKCECESGFLFPSLDIILSDNQKKARNTYIKEISNNIKSNTMALITGAGVSKPCGMPLWNDLISQMIGYSIQYDIVKDRVLGISDESYDILSDLASQLIKKDLSILGKVNPLELAEYISESFKDSENYDIKHNQIPDIFIKTIIRRVIKDSFSPIELLKKDMRHPSNSELASRYNFNEKDIESFIKNVKPIDIASLNTMFAVSYLLYHENGIRQVITYNFDPLVQECLLDLYKIDKSEIITHSEKFCDDSSCFVGSNLREFYHIHGFVAGERHMKHDCSHIFPPDSEHIILSEDSYYRVEQEEAYNWSSSVQSYFLNKYNCLFIGFSAEDYNFKRIIRQIKFAHSNTDVEQQNQRNHYLIMPIEDWARNIYEDVCRSTLKHNEKITCSMVNEISEKTVMLIRKTLTYRENYWKGKNIYPLWATINEIPKLLTSFIY